MATSQTEQEQEREQDALAEQMREIVRKLDESGMTWMEIEEIVTQEMLRND